MNQSLLFCGILMSLSGFCFAGDRIYGFLQMYERAILKSGFNYGQMMIDELSCSTCTTLTKRLEFFVSNMAKACTERLPDVRGPVDEARYVNLTMEFLYSFIVYRAPVLNEYVDKALLQCVPDYSVLPPESGTFGWAQFQETMHWFMTRSPSVTSSMEENMRKMDESIDKTSLSFQKKRDTTGPFFDFLTEINLHIMSSASFAL